MTDIFYKISRISLLSIMAISLIFLGLFYFGGAVDNTEGTTSYEPLITGNILRWSYFLLVIAIGTSLFFFLGNLFNDAKKLKNFGLAVGTVALVVLVSYLFSSTELLDIEVRDYPDNVPSVLSFADTALFSMYILLGVAIISILYSSIAKMAK